MQLTVDGKKYEVEFVGTDGDARVVNVNGRFYAVTLMGDPPASVAAVAPPSPSAPKPAAAPAAAAATVQVAEGETILAAPMPGTVLEVKVKTGQAVSRGDALMVLESMKMENNLPAPAAGTVKQILKSSGDQVTRGETLIILGVI